MASQLSADSDWAGVPNHVLDIISDKLELLSDYVRFSAVCLSWRSIGVYNQKRRQNKTCNSFPPLLMIPTKDGSKKMRSFYSIIDRKIYDFQLPIRYNRRCCGSNHGWLISYNTKTFTPTLFNPFLSHKIFHLPSHDTTFFRHFGRCSIPKVVLSANPDPSINDQGYAAASIYCVHRKLAFMKPGDKSWTYMDAKTCPYNFFYDAIFYRGRLLAVNNYGGVISVDVFNDQEVEEIAPGDEDGIFGHIYLVESSSTGDLLLIRRVFYDVGALDEETKYDYMTMTFEVYKLVLDDQTGMVIERILMKNLGEEALFLGDNYSMSILTSKYLGLKGNSIYYTDDYTAYDHGFGPRDNGIFSLDNGSIEQLNLSQKRMPGPIWIVPTLQEIHSDVN